MDPCPTIGPREPRIWRLPIAWPGSARTILAFADHYRGNGEWRADWSAVFRSWCRRERKFYPAQAPRTRAEKEAEFKAGLNDMAAQLRAKGFQGLPKGEPQRWGARP